MMHYAISLYCSSSTATSLGSLHADGLLAAPTQLWAEPPEELSSQQIPLFADPLQHGAILLSSAHQVGERVLH